MTKRETDWISIYTPEGERKIASPDYIKKLLKVPSVSNILSRLARAETKIERLESPQRQEKIIRLLKEHGKHNKIWLGNRVDFRHYDLAALREAGRIVETRSGSQSMIGLSDTEEGLDPCSECGSPATHPSGVCRDCYQAIKELT